LVELESRSAVADTNLLVADTNLPVADTNLPVADKIRTSGTSGRLPEAPDGDTRGPIAVVCDPVRHIEQRHALPNPRVSLLADQTPRVATFRPLTRGQNRGPSQRP